ncbi:hypothetical protein K8I31_00680, partial [bacterium]|nr:hypothetical protein [bacterium]
LNKVVQRFAREVQTNRLRRLIDIDEIDIKLIDSEMSKCSKFLPGHDNAAAINQLLPEPEEVQEDIEKLNNYIDILSKKRKRT